MTVVNSTLLPGLSFDKDDVSGDVSSITIDLTDPATLSDFSAIGNLASADEAVAVSLLKELAERFKNKLTDLDCPIVLDDDGTFFDNFGFTDRDSGTTDNDGNAVTELQKYRKYSLVAFFKLDESTDFAVTGVVNDDD